MIQNIEEAQDAAPTLRQATPLVVFCPDVPAFSPRVLTIGANWRDFPECADNAHTTKALTDTPIPYPAIPVAVGRGKINSNIAQTTDIQTAPLSLTARPESDIMSAASFGGSDDNLDYVELAEKTPTSSYNTPDLEGHIRKLETTHELLEGDINTIAQPTVFFYLTNELKMTEFADSETGPPENL